jgi:hypothetical protein
MIRLDKQNPIESLSLLPLSMSFELLSPPKHSYLIKIVLKTSASELTWFPTNDYSQELATLVSTLKINIIIS